METDIPFVPSSDERLSIMMELAGIKPGEVAVDLGSGDGKVVIAMAKAGALVTGYEIEPLRVYLARHNIEKEELSNPPRIVHRDFWKADLSAVDLVTVYGITSIMPRLEKKLIQELKSGAKVVSNYFPFPNWMPDRKKGEVYLYIRD